MIPKRTKNYYFMIFVICINKQEGKKVYNYYTEENMLKRYESPSFVSLYLQTSI